MKKNMKRIVALLGAMTMTVGMMTGCSEEAATSSAASSDTAAAEESDTVSMGFVLPLTGSVPNIGAAMQNGAQLAIDEINAAGGVMGKQIEPIFEDDENKPATAPNAITKLIEQNKVDVVLGTYASSCSMAMTSIAADSETLMISIGSTNSKVTEEGGDYIFRACFIDPLQGSIGAQFAYEDMGVSKVAMLYDVGKDYCVGISDTFSETFTSLGGEIVYEGKYNTGDTDFKSYLTEIKNSGAEVLYVPDDYDVVGLIAKQVKEIGLEIEMLGSDSWSSPDLISIGGDAVEGYYFTDHVSIKSDALAGLVSAYTEKFGEDPSSFSVLAYDAVYIAAAAMTNAGTTTDDAALVAALNELDEVCGTTNYKFDELGDPIKNVIINQVVDGAFEFVTEIAAG